MTKYCAVNSLAGCFRNSTLVKEATTAGTFSSAYVPNSISVPNNGTDYFETYAFSASGVVWTRFNAYGGIGGSNGVGPQWYSGTTNVFRLTGSSNWQPAYWNGSAWTNIGTAFAFSDAVLHTVVLKIDLAGGTFEVYLDGTLQTSGSGMTGLASTITSFRGYGWRNANTYYYSEIMVADYDIRDARLMNAALNGNSAANTGGSGAYTDINETVLDESTSENVATVGNKMGQTHAAITVPGGLGIAAKVITARGRVVGGTVSDGKLGIRSGSTNSSSSGRIYNGGYEPRGYIADADPNTSGAWTQTSFNASETYIEAAA